MAHLLAEHPDYVGRTLGSVTITGYQTALASAKADLTRSQKLLAALRSPRAPPGYEPVPGCRGERRFYESTQTYGMPVVYAWTAGRIEDVTAIAPEAGYLLTAAFPTLSLAQADLILTQTEGRGGGFLDDGSAFGLYSRLDLFAAGKKAATMSSTSQTLDSNSLSEA